MKKKIKLEPAIIWKLVTCQRITTKLSEYRKFITIISVIYETFEPDIHNIFGEIIFGKLETSQRTYALINVFATQQFCSFRWLLFHCYWNSWKLRKLLKLTNSLNFWIWFVHGHTWPLLWVESYANKQKCKHDLSEDSINVPGLRTVLKDFYASHQHAIISSKKQW